MSGSGFTITANTFVALNGGTPLSVTIVVRVLLVPDCARSGVQMITPLVGLITGLFVPVTVLVSAEVKVGAGTAASVAVLVTTSRFNGFKMRVPCAGSTGGGLVGVAKPKRINR